MSLYTRARKHIDMNRVKELREERIKREQIAEILRQQEEISAELEYIEAEESKYINWRRELEEGMNTSGMGMINLPAEGNVDIIDTSTTYDNLNSGLSQMDNYSRSGTTVTLQGTENQIVNDKETKELKTSPEIKAAEMEVKKYEDALNEIDSSSQKGKADKSLLEGALNSARSKLKQLRENN